MCSPTRRLEGPPVNGDVPQDVGQIPPVPPAGLLPAPVVEAAHGNGTARVDDGKAPLDPSPGPAGPSPALVCEHSGQPGEAARPDDDGEGRPPAFPAVPLRDFLGGDGGRMHRGDAAPVDGPGHGCPANDRRRPEVIDIGSDDDDSGFLSGGGSEIVLSSGDDESIVLSSDDDEKMSISSDGGEGDASEGVEGEGDVPPPRRDDGRRDEAAMEAARRLLAYEPPAWVSRFWEGVGGDTQAGAATSSAAAPPPSLVIFLRPPTPPIQEVDDILPYVIRRRMAPIFRAEVAVRDDITIEEYFRGMARDFSELRCLRGMVWRSRGDPLTILCGGCYSSVDQADWSYELWHSVQTYRKAFNYFCKRCGCCPFVCRVDVGVCNFCLAVYCQGVNRLYLRDGLVLMVPEPSPLQ